MNKPIRSILLLILLVISVAVYFAAYHDVQSPDQENSQITAREGDPDQFALYNAAIRTAEGEDHSAYPQNYLMKELERARFASKANNSPQVIPWRELGPSNVGGRTRAIVVDPDDPTNSTWTAASVSGGIWKTTDAGNSWTHLSESLPNLAFTSLVQSTSDPTILYAGTGEGYANIDAVKGAGIFRSSDRGVSWHQLASTSDDGRFSFVNRMIVSPSDANVVIAATRSGIFRSTDGGSSWIQTFVATPPGVGSLQVIAHPDAFDRMYATDANIGVIRSLDAGLTWQPASIGLDGLGEGPTTGSVSQSPRVEMAIAPSDPNRIYAVMESSDGSEQLFISSDAASTWFEIEMANGLPAPDIALDQGWYDLSLAVHPTDENVLFVGGLNIYRVTFSGAQPGGALAGLDEEGTTPFLSFVSFLSATHFDGRIRTGLSEAGSGITNADFVSVEIRFGPGMSQKAHRFIPPDGPGIKFSDYPYADYVNVPFEVWDITNNRQLMVSFRDRLHDGAFDLIPRDTLNLGREYVLIHAVDYDPLNPNPEIGMNGGAQNKMLYFFWPMGPDDTVWDAASLPASILRINFESAQVPARQMQLISSSGFVHVDQHFLLAMPGEAGAGSGAISLLAGTDGGVFYSKNEGASWEAQGSGYNTTQFYGVDKAPGLDRYFGGTQDNGSQLSVVSPSETSAWAHVIGGDGFEVAWNQEDLRFILGSFQFNQLRRSDDGGITFHSATSGLSDVGSGNGGQFLTSIARSIDNPFTVFTLGESGVWKSKDFGGSWMLRPIASSDWDFGFSGKVRVSLADSRIVWAGYEMDPILLGANDELGKLHVSTNFGDTFTPVTTPITLSPGRISGLATHPLEPETAFALFSVAGRPKILRTRDLGQTWEDLSGFVGSPAQSSNGFPDVAVFDLLVIPDRHFEIWAGTEIGLFISRDNGVSWSFANNGLPAVSIFRMRIVDDKIVVATHGRGVWSVDLALSVAVEEDPVPTELPAIVDLEQNYPNPFNPETNISFSLPRPESVTVTVYDISGRRVATLMDERLTAGHHTTTFDASALASGTYLYKLVAGDIIKSRTMVLVK